MKNQVRSSQVKSKIRIKSSHYYIKFGGIFLNHEIKKDDDQLINIVFKQQQRTIEELKKTIQEQQKTIDEQRKIIDEISIQFNREKKKIVGFNYALSEDIQVQIKKLRNQGYSYKKISLCFGISTSTAYKYSNND